jgi:hypothetical protein
MLSDKEVISLGSEDDEEIEDPPVFITILKAALKTERGEDAPANPRIRFNDLSTADFFIQVMPDGPLLSLHKTIIQTNLFFASFDLAVIDRIFNIDAPDPETCSFVIECIYHFSSIERVVKLDDVLFQGFVDEYIKRKFVGVVRNASFFKMDDLLYRCYLLFVLTSSNFL